MSSNPMPSPAPFARIPGVPQLRRLYAAPWLGWALVALGMVLRVIQYLSNRTLWIDEAWISLNIIHRSFGQLFEQLDYEQGAPVGFLLVEKLFVQIFGSGELALRLLPLLCGLLAMVIFYLLAKQLLQRNACLLAVTLFAVSHFLIYFASEIKQYSGDVLVAVLVLWLAAPYLSGTKLTWRGALVFAVVGAVGIWFSHPAIFMLVSVGLVLFVATVVAKDWHALPKLIVMGAAWLISFAASYVISLSKLGKNPDLLADWQGQLAFMPIPPSPGWLLTTYMKMIVSPGGFGGYIAGLEGIAALFVVLGAVVMSWTRVKYIAVLLIPFVVALSASAIQDYPFADRLLLFLVPILLVLAAEGAEWLRQQAAARSALIGLMIVGALLIDPVANATRPITLRAELKPAFAYLQNHLQEGDAIYVMDEAQFVLQYYAPRYGFDKVNVIDGPFPSDVDNVPPSIDKLAGLKRVWVVIAYLDDTTDTLTLRYLNIKGRQLDSFQGRHAELYLYDFSQNASLVTH